MCRRIEEVGPTVGLPTPKTFRRVLKRARPSTDTGPPFLYGYSGKPPHLVAFCDTLWIQRTHSWLKPPGPPGGGVVPPLYFIIMQLWHCTSSSGLCIRDFRQITNFKSLSLCRILQRSTETMSVNKSQKCMSSFIQLWGGLGTTISFVK